MLVPRGGSWWPDELDGGEATQTLRFAIGNVSYELDVSDKNAAKLEKAVAPFVAAARRVRSVPGQSRSSSSTSGLDVAAVRA